MRLGRRPRAKASNPQAAHIPRSLSFRRRRPKLAGKPVERSPRGLTFQRRRRKPASKPLERRVRRMTFRRSRTETTHAAADGMPKRLSFRRGRPRALSAPVASSARALSFRRSRPKPPTAPANTPLRKLTLRRGRRAESSPRPERQTASDPFRLTVRLVAVGFVACMLQLLIVSQIGVLGVTAEVAPLVVAATGFLCGSLVGAAFGFGVGLFIDLAFVQVLGISSLLFTLIGYGAGRLRELRAPTAPLTRLALGAAATVLALGGYGAIEFMLGVNTPVSYGLLGAIVKTTALNSLIALPVYALTRRALLGALPTSERLADRAATTKRMSPLTRA